MPVTAEVTALEENRVRLDVAVSEDEVKRKVDRAVRAIARNMRVPGFRPGKAPSTVIIQRVGREAVMEQMLRDSLGEWYVKALEETGVEPIDDPDLDLPDGPGDGDLSFTATVQLRPKATLGTYRGIEVGKAEPELPEEDVRAELESLRDQVARLETVDRPAEVGDFVTIDFDGTIGGQPVEGTSARDYLVELGGSRLLPGFDTALAGMGAGEEKIVPISYRDDDERTELAGKSVEYTVRVSRVQAKVLPELDDAFADQASEFDTLAELEADVRSRLGVAAQAEVDERFRRAVIDAVVEEAKLDVPDVMIDRRVDAILHQMAHRLPQGIGLDDYIRATGRTEDQVREELRPDAEMAVRRELVVDAVAEAEGISVTDEEVEAQVRTDAEASERDPDELLAELRRRGGFEALRDDLRMRKAVDLLIESAVAIPMAQAEARERIWTPPTPAEEAAAAGGLWTPEREREEREGRR